MTINELVNKHCYITDICNWNNKVEVTILIDIEGVRHNTLQDMSFETIEDCDKYLTENYLRLKYELLELLFNEKQNKCEEQRIQLYRLNKAHLRLVNKVSMLIKSMMK